MTSPRYKSKPKPPRIGKMPRKPKAKRKAPPKIKRRFGPLQSPGKVPTVKDFFTAARRAAKGRSDNQHL